MAHAVITFDSGQQVGQLPYAGRHRKAPRSLRAALWVGRRVGHARPRAGIQPSGHEPAEAVSPAE